MKPKTTILLVLAVGCGLVAAFMTNKLIAEKSKGNEEVEKVTVLVAQKKVMAMAFVKKPEDLFVVQEKPKSEVRGTPISDLTDKDIKEGFRVSRTLSEGSVLTRDDVISKESEGVEARLKKGERAVAIRVTADKLAGGFVRPGAHVDVMWTSRGAGGEVNTLTILQDMEVLAVDTIANRDPAAPTILGNTITLAVKPEEAQKLAAASGSGELSLALRSASDDKRNQLSGTKQGDLAKQTSQLVEIDRPDSGGVDGAGPAIPPTVPTLPPAKPMKAPTPEAPPVVEKPKPAKTHTIVIQDGPSWYEHTYVWNEEKKIWDGGKVTRSEVEPKPETKDKDKDEKPGDGPGADKFGPKSGKF